MTVHNPLRPHWLCCFCGADWPCHTRRQELRAEYAGAPISLSVSLAGCFAQAAADLPHLPAGWLHNRMLGWLHEPVGSAPYSSPDLLVDAYEVAKEHTPDQWGHCPTCGGPDTCWVRLDPRGPGIVVPLP